RRSACASIWRTRSRVSPMMRPISSSDFGSGSPSIPYRSFTTSFSRSGSVSTAWRTTFSARLRCTSSTGSDASPANRSPNVVSPSSPTGRSRLVTARAAERTSATCFGESCACFALCARALLLALDDVNGNADRARLVGNPALNRLANPPRRVGRELVAAAPVELLDGPDQSDDSFLDQVEQRDPVALVLLHDRHDEPKVRVDHQILRALVSALDPLRELDLLLCGQQLVAAGLVEEELEGVGGCHGG